MPHGDIVWVDFGSPRGSEPAKRPPAVIMQENDGIRHVMGI